MNDHTRAILSFLAFVTGFYLIAWLVAKLCLWSLTNAIVASGGIVTAGMLTKSLMGAAMIGGSLGLWCATLVNSQLAKQLRAGIQRAKDATMDSRFERAKVVN